MQMAEYFNEISPAKRAALTFVTGFALTGGCMDLSQRLLMPGSSRSLTLIGAVLGGAAFAARSMDNKNFRIEP
ncbi:MAG: hypothetical protein DYH13_04525 [Alphaproteobacteria bacterium PRO2]|nr:hypothetical protein [Alphaproteobacteria bacterium PRO2]